MGRGGGTRSRLRGGTSNARHSQRTDVGPPGCRTRGVLDELASLRAKNTEIDRRIGELNRHPGTPQEVGRAAESVITEMTGWQKNTIGFETSFADSSAPTGNRIPDFATNSAQVGQAPLAMEKE